MRGTLYVTDHRARLHMHHGTLLVEQPGRKQRVPIEALEGVVLTGRADISNDTMGELVRRGVRIAALSRTGRVRFTVSGATSGNVHLRVAQFAASGDPLETARLARWFVAAKLENCRRAIRRWSWDARGRDREVMERESRVIADRIGDLTSSIDGDKIRGIEGDGTRRYFRCLAIHLDTGDETMGFVRRSRRPPRDPANAVLSFTYGLLLAELVGALDAVGLDPQVGFLHRPRSGRPGLALDLLEEMRPSVADRFSVGVVMRRQIRREHFQVVGTGFYLSDEGRKALLALYDGYRSADIEHRVLGRSIGRWMLPTVQATLLARHLRGDLPVYPPFVSTA
ncbi:MAG: CRISPR-associated endonuclease Cas1 [Actinomycetota bacterium]|nr:CRISPR-associated endonuclease Cas1 [Actinomycetota bacterium]